MVPPHLRWKRRLDLECRCPVAVMSLGMSVPSWVCFYFLSASIHPPSSNLKQLERWSHANKSSEGRWHGWSWANESQCAVAAYGAFGARCILTQVSIVFREQLFWLGNQRGMLPHPHSVCVIFNSRLNRSTPPFPWLPIGKSSKIDLTGTS